MTAPRNIYLKMRNNFSTTVEEIKAIKRAEMEKVVKQKNLLKQKGEVKVIEEPVEVSPRTKARKKSPKNTAEGLETIETDKK